MARIVKIDGRTYIAPPWQDEQTNVYTIIGDNMRERRDTERQILTTMYLYAP